MSAHGHTLVRPGVAIYVQCLRMARVRAPWWSTAPKRTEWEQSPAARRRESLAMQLASATVRADQGATRQAHRDDVARVALMATMLRNDWTPAAVVAWLDGLDGGEA